MSDNNNNEQIWKPRVNPWIIAATVALAAFMEVLDTSIANVALPHIAGDLAVSTDDSTWVLTSYLVSNAIVLPLGAWASSVIGRKEFFPFMYCAVHRCEPSLRHCLFASHIATVGHHSRSRRWWLAADGASDHGGFF